METLSSREDADIDNPVVKETTKDSVGDNNNIKAGNLVDGVSVKDMMTSASDADKDLLDSVSPPTDDAVSGNGRLADQYPDGSISSKDTLDSVSSNKVANGSVDKRLPDSFTDDADNSNGRIADGDPDGSMHSKETPGLVSSNDADNGSVDKELSDSLKSSTAGGDNSNGGGPDGSMSSKETLGLVASNDVDNGVGDKELSDSSKAPTAGADNSNGRSPDGSMSSKETSGLVASNDGVVDKELSDSLNSSTDGADNSNGGDPDGSKHSKETPGLVSSNDADNGSVDKELPDSLKSSAADADNSNGRGLDDSMSSKETLGLVASTTADNGVVDKELPDSLKSSTADADNSNGGGPDGNMSSKETLCLVASYDADDGVVDKELPDSLNSSTDGTDNNNGRVGDKGSDGSMPTSNDVRHGSSDKKVPDFSDPIEGSLAMATNRDQHDINECASKGVSTCSKANLADSSNTSKRADDNQSLIRAKIDNNAATSTVASSDHPENNLVDNSITTGDDHGHKNEVNIKPAHDADNGEHSTEKVASDYCDVDSEGPTKAAERSSDQGEDNSFNNSKRPDPSNTAKLADHNSADVGNASDMPSSTAADDSVVEASGNNGGTFDCRFCANSFQTDADRVKHEQGHKFSRVAKFKCDICSEKFTKGCLLKHHRKTHFSGKSFKQFQCDVCSQEFGRKDHLNRHLQNIHMRNKKCKFCGKLFDDKLILEAHENTHEGSSPKFKYTCQECGKCFSNSWNLQRHGIMHSPVKVFCNYCGESFDKKEKLRDHKLEVHDEGSPTVEESAGTDSSNKAKSSAKKVSSAIKVQPNETISSLEQSKPSSTIPLSKQHKDGNTTSKQHKDGNITLSKCRYCSLEFTTDTELLRHEATHSRRQVFSCMYCGATFSQRGTLKVHEMEKHMEDELPEDVDRERGIKAKTDRAKKSHGKLFLCAYCGASFSQRGPLQAHERKEHPEKELPEGDDHLEGDGQESEGVPDTGNVKDADKSKQDVVEDSHKGSRLKSGQADVDVSPHKCRYCHSSFNTTLQLREHEITHARGKTFVCEYCGATFSQMGTLKIHEMQRHLDQEVRAGNKRKLSSHVPPKPKAKMYYCDKCSESFTSEAERNKHVMKHPTCYLCDKRFANDRGLQTHMHIHHSGNQFKCETCKKQFSHLAQLKRHQVFHEEDRPFKCGSCEATYKQKWALQQHQVTHSDYVYKCDQCGKRFRRPYSLQRHQAESCCKAAQEYNCLQCKQVFTNKEECHQHIIINHAEVLYKCTNCQQTFKNVTELNKHEANRSFCSQYLASQSPKDDDVYRCSDCKESFEDIISLGCHTCQIVEGVKKCGYCQESFESSERLKEHEQTMHKTEKKNGAEEVVHKCASCHQDFETLKSLQEHEEVCEPKNRDEVIGDGLNSHREAADEREKVKPADEQGEQPVEAAASLQSNDGKAVVSSDKEPAQQTDDKQKADSTEEDETFSCELCELTFDTQSLLSTHEETHKIPDNSSQAVKTVISYKCDKCEKSFARFQDCVNHEQGCNFSKETKKQQGDGAFTCGYCVASFTSKELLKKHLSSHLHDLESSGSEVEALSDSVANEDEGFSLFKLSNRRSTKPIFPFGNGEDLSAQNKSTGASKRGHSKSATASSSLTPDGTRSRRSSRKRLSLDATPSGSASKRQRAKSESVSPVSPNVVVTTTRRGRNVVTPARFREQLTMDDDDFEEIDDTEEEVEEGFGDGSGIDEDNGSGDEDDESVNGDTEDSLVESETCGKVADKVQSNKKKNKKSKRLDRRLGNYGSKKVGSYTCRLCPSTFNGIVRLKNHQVIHKRKGKLQCRYCNAGFDHKQYQLDHERIHTGHLYSCKMCSSTFKWVYNLKRHMESQHDVHMNTAALMEEDDMNRDEGVDKQSSGNRMKGPDVSSRNLRSKKKNIHKEAGKQSLDREKKELLGRRRSDRNIEEGGYKQSHGREESESDENDSGEEVMEIDTDRLRLESDRNNDGDNKVSSEVEEKEAHENSANQSSSEKKKVAYKCELCPSTFSGPGKFHHHKYVHTRNYEHKCSYCSASYRSKVHKEEHERLHTGHLYRCQFCDTTYIWGDGWERHMKGIHGIDTTIEKRKLQEDQKLRASVGERKAVTIHLRKLDVDAVSMSNESVSSEPGMREEEQKICRKLQEQLVAQTVDEKKKEEGEYEQSSQLWKEEDGKFMCSLCPGIYNTKYYMIQHLEVHGRNREFKCRYCSASYNAESHLENHERLHTGDVTRCDVCNKTFTWDVTLRRHLKTRRHLRRVAQSKGVPVSDSYEKGEAESSDEKEEMDVQSMSSASSDEDEQTKSSKESQKVGGEEQDVCQEQLVALTVDKKKEDVEYEQSSKLWKEEDGKFTCSLCPGIYNARFYIIQHLEVHTRNSEFKCRYCSASYNAERHLENHSASILAM
ncbi:uncharacterized protein [Amphiura filiformis]|uniref:uncharacterized protein n=1 Tax=Amphiura filiformis TaxID=82378 RepID=UPI003B21174F